MYDEDDDRESFDERLRSLAREVSQSFERVAHTDFDDVMEAIGVDRARATEILDSAAGWLRGVAEQVGRDEAPRMPGSVSVSDEASLSSVGPRPFDLPTAQQGTALAALDSGRWTVEPGGQALVAHGEGTGPGHVDGIVDELRARDWLTADGTVTVAGRHALGRWLDASQPE